MAPLLISCKGTKQFKEVKRKAIDFKDTSTVRADWIYMRVVLLDRPLKGDEPPIGWFFNFTLEYLKRLQSSEPLHAKMNPTSCFHHGCIESCLPIGWCTFIWWKNPPKCCFIFVWIAGCWNSLLTSRNPKNNWCLSRIFVARFGGKDHGLSTCKPWSKQVGGWIIFAWRGSELWTLIKYSRSKIKNKKPTAVDVLFKPYPMVPLTCRSNLAGRYL